MCCFVIGILVLRTLNLGAKIIAVNRTNSHDRTLIFYCFHQYLDKKVGTSCSELLTILKTMVAPLIGPQLDITLPTPKSEPQISPITSIKSLFKSFLLHCDRISLFFFLPSFASFFFFFFFLLLEILRIVSSFLPNIK